MKKLKIGVIGCGNIATAAHIPGYEAASDKAEIVWFCDIIPERAQAKAEAHGGKWTPDYREVLADPEVDAISVCTPNHWHSEITVAALEAGKHVLCEKPAAINYDEAKRMKEARDKTDLVLNIGVVNRFNDSVRKIKELIDDGVLGDIYHVVVSFRAQRSIPGLGGNFTTKAVAGGGALIDWGVHYLDIVMYCTGDPKPETVSAAAFSKLGSPIEDYVYEGMWAGPPVMDGTFDVDDSITALVRTEGPVISMNGAWAENIGTDERYIDFIGDKAGIHLIYGGGFTLYGTKDGKLTKEEFGTPESNMFNNEIADFLDCITEGRTNAADIDNAILTSRMMQAMYDSSDARREIVLD